MGCISKSIPVLVTDSDNTLAIMDIRLALMKDVKRRSEQEYSGPQNGDCILYFCENKCPKVSV